MAKTTGALDYLQPLPAQAPESTKCISYAYTCIVYRCIKAASSSSKLQKRQNKCASSPVQRLFLCKCDLHLLRPIRGLKQGQGQGMGQERMGTACRCPMCCARADVHWVVHGAWCVANVCTTTQLYCRRLSRMCGASCWPAPPLAGCAVRSSI
jgi:hypothetical protein